MKNFAKRMLALIREKILSQNSINGHLSLGKDSNIFGSNIFGNIYSGQNCIIKNLNLNGELKIGKYTTIWGPNINMYGHIEIGSFCSVANNVSIFCESHNYKRITTYYIFKNLFEEVGLDGNNKEKVKIGSDVWIGSSVIILKGVTIGDGAVIGANSLITTDVPPYSIVAGNPSKILKYRFSEEIIQELLALKWWDWDVRTIRSRRSLFSEELSLEMIRRNSSI